MYATRLASTNGSVSLSSFVGLVYNHNVFVPGYTLATRANESLNKPEREIKKKTLDGDKPSSGQLRHWSAEDVPSARPSERIAKEMRQRWRHRSSCINFSDENSAKSDICESERLITFLYIHICSQNVINALPPSRATSMPRYALLFFFFFFLA